jgi:hypothetical protein
LIIDHAEEVAAVREKYINLTYVQQSLVTKLSILEAAETKINELEDAG